jgi:hypothetical protein
MASVNRHQRRRRAAMERLYTAGKIVTITTGPKSKPVSHIERMDRE